MLNVTYKPLRALFAYADDGDNAARTFHVACNARDRRAILRQRQTFKALLREHGYVEPGGCDCTHCANDWDCCGRMVPSMVRVSPARRGVTVTQHYSRNV